MLFVLCTYTTVHFIVGSGYEAGFVARQESDDGGNLFGLSHSTERHALRYHILVGFRGLVRKLGLAVIGVSMGPTPSELTRTPSFANSFAHARVMV